MTATVVLLALLLLVSARHESTPSLHISTPVLAVTMIYPQVAMLPVRVQVSGNIVAKQEISISTEIDGLKLSEVKVDTGDVVERGQLLAKFNADMIEAELAEVTASVAEAEAILMEADTNFKRAKALEHTGAMSAKLIDQHRIAALTAQARLNAAQATEQKHRLRLAQTEVLAPVNGTISARTATIGAVVPAAEALFRLIEDGRLEWRAVVSISDIEKLMPGQAVSVTTLSTQSVQGTLRSVAPTINTETHTGLAYIDLPRNTSLKAGAFARGHIDVSNQPALTLPQQAVIQRDGFHYVMQVNSHSVVQLKKITIGQRAAGKIEIMAGIKKSDSVIASGLAFLSEGDSVAITEPPEFTTHQTNNTLTKTLQGMGAQQP